jgi:hypothetical protein
MNIFPITATVTTTTTINNYTKTTHFFRAGGGEGNTQETDHETSPALHH